MGNSSQPAFDIPSISLLLLCPPLSSHCLQRSIQLNSCWATVRHFTWITADAAVKVKFVLFSFSPCAKRINWKTKKEYVFTRQRRRHRHYCVNWLFISWNLYYNFYLIMMAPPAFSFHRSIMARTNSQISRLFSLGSSTAVRNKRATKIHFLLLLFYILNWGLPLENKNDMKIGSRYQQSYSPTGLHKGKFKRKCVLNKKDDGKKSLSIINNNNNQTEAVCDSREIKCTAESTKPLSHCSCAYVGPPTHGSRYLRMEREREKNSRMHLPNSFLSKFTEKIRNDSKISKQNQRPAAISFVVMTETERYDTQTAHIRITKCVGVGAVTFGILLLVSRV